MSALTLVRDGRHALRMLVRTPGFTLIAILTFAVGIGVNTAVFNVVNGVLLRPLPYVDADRITMLWMDNRRDRIPEDITSYPNYVDWRDQSSSYEHMAAYSSSAFSLTGAGEPERLQGASVTASFFDVFAMRPVLGRLFSADQETPGRDAVVVLSYGLWQRRFGGTGDVLGRTITLSGRPHEIIGVMPAALEWPPKAELWKPLAPSQQAREARGGYWLPVIGRLKDGVSVEQARTEMNGIAARLEREYPANRGFGINVVALQQQLVGNIERVLFVLLAAVGFVLLIACANLANLMLGRTAARRKELAIRTALGAGRWRLVRQIVTETSVLAGIGGALGVLLAHLATQFFVSLGGDSIPRSTSIGMDLRVLGFALVVVTVATLLAGVIPAFQASRPLMVDHLREGGRQGGGGASHRTRSALVAVEVALAFVLLTGAGLLIRTLWSMQGLDRGFRTDGVAIATVSLPSSAYPGQPEVRAFFARLLERVRSTPGVEAAATASGVLQPIVTNSGTYSIEGKPLPAPEERVEYPVEAVSPGFFETLRVQIVRGRSFTDQDHAEAPRVVVINETLARIGWADQDPIGRRIRSGGENSQAPWLTVVGVIRDVHRGDVTRTIRPEVYLSALQSAPRTQTVVVRTSGEPTAILSTLRRQVQEIDPQLPLFAVETLDSAVAATLRRPRLQATLLAYFAIIALLLATVGIYGVTAHGVSQRTQEMGIRMALGANRASVLRLVLWQHLRPALIGVAAGVGGALIVSQTLSSLLHGVAATDPVTFASMSLALVLVAAIACWIPARRATRVDPLAALRTE